MLDNVKDFVSNLPAPIRHFVAALIGIFAMAVAVAVVANGGVTNLDWLPLLQSSFDKGIVGALGTVGILAGTNLTPAYGLFKEKEVVTGSLPAPLPSDVAPVDDVVDDTVEGLPDDNEDLPLDDGESD